MTAKENRPGGRSRAASELTVRAATSATSLAHVTPRRARLATPTGCPFGCPLSHHEPPCPAAVKTRADRTPRFDCDRCLTFDYDERERLETCWQSRRCTLAGRLVGGGRR